MHFFLAALTAACFTAVAGQSSYVFELSAKASLDSKKLLDGKYIKQLKDEVKMKATSDEVDVLRSLLLERQHWKPYAPELLHDVLSRPSPERRLSDFRSVSCSSYDNSSCNMGLDDECQTCVWQGWRNCVAPTCDMYTSEQACCSNENNVKEGCFWNEYSQECVVLNGGSFSADIDCQNFVRGACPDGGDSCEEAESACDEIAEKCRFYPGKGCMAKPEPEYPATNILEYTCFAKSCNDCVSSNDGDRLSCDEEADLMLGPVCQESCSKVVHTTDEATCLAKSKGCGSIEDKCALKKPPPTSCKVYPQAPGVGTDEGCKAECAEIESMCGVDAQPGECLGKIEVDVEGLAIAMLLSMIIPVVIELIVMSIATYWCWKKHNDLKKQGITPTCGCLTIMCCLFCTCFACCLPVDPGPAAPGQPAGGQPVIIGQAVAVPQQNKA